MFFLGRIYFLHQLFGFYPVILISYCRLCGYQSLYISGADEYGTATEMKALVEGVGNILLSVDSAFSFYPYYF